MQNNEKTNSNIYYRGTRKHKKIQTINNLVSHICTRRVTEDKTVNDACQDKFMEKQF